MLVLDTCVVVKWFLDEDDSDRATEYLQSLLLNNLSVAVPSLLFYEAANVLWCRQRRGMARELATSMFRALTSLPLQVVDWPIVTPVSLELAMVERISPYDAVFVALARELECDLITANQPLWKKTHRACPWVKRF